MTTDNPNFFVRVTKLKMWLRIIRNNPNGRGRARQQSCIFQGLISEITMADKMNILLLNICHVAFKSYWFPSLPLRRTNVITPVAAKASSPLSIPVFKVRMWDRPRRHSQTCTHANTQNLQYMTNHHGYQKLMDSEIDTIPILPLIKTIVMFYCDPHHSHWRIHREWEQAFALLPESCSAHIIADVFFFLAVYGVRKPSQ